MQAVQNIAKISVVNSIKNLFISIFPLVNFLYEIAVNRAIERFFGFYLLSLGKLFAYLEVDIVFKIIETSQYKSKTMFARSVIFTTVA